MVGSLCNTTKSKLKEEGTKIGRVVEESSTISCYNDYNKLITFWDGEQDFVDYMVNTKDQLNELKDELSRLLEIAKSFPKEKININTVTDLQRSFSTARPFSDVAGNSIKSVSNSIQLNISGAESLETVVNDRLNLCNECISYIDQLISVISTANLMIDGALYPAKQEYENYKSQLYESLNMPQAYYTSIRGFWDWFEQEYVKRHGIVKVTYDYSREVHSV